MRTAGFWVKEGLFALLFFAMGFFCGTIAAFLVYKVVDAIGFFPPNWVAKYLYHNLIDPGLMLSGGLFFSAAIAFRENPKKARVATSFLLLLSLLAGVLSAGLVLFVQQASPYSLEFGMACLSFLIFAGGWQVLWIRDARQRQGAYQQENSTHGPTS